MAKNVLFILTSHHQLGETDKSTGYHVFEAAAPWSTLKDAGFEIDFASPKGEHAPIEQSSMDRENELNRRFQSEAKNGIDNTIKLNHVDASKYDAVFFPGGHGPMWDLADNEQVHEIVRTIYEDNNGMVAAICHGPAALVGLKLSDGRYLVDGKRIACFSDLEEMVIGRDKIVPFMLAGKLREQGARHEMADNFGESVCVDGRLITGQNPASAKKLGEELRDTLKATGARAPRSRTAGQSEQRPGL